MLGSERHHFVANMQIFEKKCFFFFFFFFFKFQPFSISFIKFSYRSQKHMPASTSASPLVGEVNVLALKKNTNLIIYFLLIIFCCIPHTYTMRYTVLQRTYLPSYVRKVQRPAVSLRTPGPTVYPSTSRWLWASPHLFRRRGEGPVAGSPYRKTNVKDWHRKSLIFKVTYRLDWNFACDPQMEF